MDKSNLILSRFVPKKEIGKRFVIADIHGCAQTFKKLVESINLTKDDQLFLLGDYIDRGPRSKMVIDYIIYLIKSGYNIYPIRGNHEESLLQAYKEYDKDTFTLILNKITKTPDLLDENNNLSKEHIEFLEGLPYFIELDNYFLVHGGFNTNKEDPFTDYKSMINLYINDNTYDTSILNGKKLIHGHKVTEIQEIEKKINENSQLIPLDNGCVYSDKHKIYDTSKVGSLLCLNIDTFELVAQQNIEKCG